MNKMSEKPFTCDKCNFSCKYLSKLKIHEQTELHKTGKKKVRSDYKGISKCSHCKYLTDNVVNLKQHILNSHATKEERKKGFKYYCINCDFGTFSISAFELHNKTDKHKNYEEYFNNK
jgi:hypothetical protein